MNVETLSDDDILKIRDYGSLFTESEESAVEKTYLALAKRWHPDRCLNQKVMPHINGLRDEALKALRSGTWEVPGRLSFTDRSGVLHWYNYRARLPFELGEMLIGDDFVVYVVTSDNKDLFGNAEAAFRRGFKFADAKMRKEFERYMPRVVESYATNDGRFVLNVAKTEDLLLLSEVTSHFPHGLPPVHSAWIITSLYNIACFLKFSGVTHNAIDASTVFISPQFHSVALLGGWWYSVGEGSKMFALPRRSVNLLPPAMKNGKLAGSTLDGELIRALGRDLVKNTGAPVKLKRWLNLPSNGDPFSEYLNWKKVLKDVWGPPKFHELKLTADEIYNVN